MITTIVLILSFERYETDRQILFLRLKLIIGFAKSKYQSLTRSFGKYILRCVAFLAFSAVVLFLLPGFFDDHSPLVGRSYIYWVIGTFVTLYVAAIVIGAAIVFASIIAFLTAYFLYLIVFISASLSRASATFFLTLLVSIFAWFDYATSSDFVSLVIIIVTATVVILTLELGSKRKPREPLVWSSLLPDGRRFWMGLRDAILVLAGASVALVGSVLIGFIGWMALVGTLLWEGHDRVSTWQQLETPIVHEDVIAIGSYALGVSGREGFFRSPVLTQCKDTSFEPYEGLSLFLKFTDHPTFEQSQLELEQSYFRRFFSNPRYPYVGPSSNFVFGISDLSEGGRKTIARLFTRSFAPEGSAELSILGLDQLTPESGTKRYAFSVFLVGYMYSLERDFSYYIPRRYIGNKYWLLGEFEFSISSDGGSLATISCGELEARSGQAFQKTEQFQDGDDRGYTLYHPIDFYTEQHMPNG